MEITHLGKKCGVVSKRSLLLISTSVSRALPQPLAQTYPEPLSRFRSY